MDSRGERAKAKSGDELFFEGSGGVLVRINDEGILALLILRDKSTLPFKRSQRLVCVLFLIYKDGCGNHHDCQPHRGVDIRVIIASKPTLFRRPQKSERQGTDTLL